jgi:hypothetical protein
MPVKGQRISVDDVSVGNVVSVCKGGAAYSVTRVTRGVGFLGYKRVELQLADARYGGTVPISLTLRGGSMEKDYEEGDYVYFIAETTCRYL